MNDTTHIEPSQGTINSLRAKLDRFMNGLTSEEQAELRVLPVAGDTTGYSTELTAKVEQTAKSITDEEWATLHRLLLSTADADTVGFRVAEYDDEFGNKGRPGGPKPGSIGDMPGAVAGANGGGGAAVGPILIFGGFLAGSLFGSRVPGEYPA